MKTTLLWLLLLSTTLPVQAGRIWWDGTRDTEAGPPGKLLSDNDGYWGDSILTGVDYHYETPPDNPADVYKDDHTKFGRRLLDGLPAGNWWVPVGVNGKPLVVVFDFKRPCVFREVDLSSRSGKVGITIQSGDTDHGPWTMVYEGSRANAPETAFHRLPLHGEVRGQFLRLSLDGGAISWLDEVWVWGNGAISPQYPEAIRPVTPVVQGTDTAFTSIPGISKTSFPDAAFWEWKRMLGSAGKLPAVWSQAPTWNSITNRPLLPLSSEANQPVSMVMARNETECAALVLTNTSSEQAISLPVSLGPFLRVRQARRGSGAPGADPGRGGAPSTEMTVKGTLRVAGAIGSRNFGVNLGPLFSADNLPGGSLMERFLTNGAGIKNFPSVTLTRGGSAVFWLAVTTNGALPGTYQARLMAGAGPEVTIRVEVLNVTLPKPRAWVQTWSSTTTETPFVYDDRQDREVAYKRSIGVSVWDGFPNPGSDSKKASIGGKPFYHVMALPDDYVNRGYNSQIKPADWTAKDTRAVQDQLLSLVQEAKKLGLTYDDWFAELWDEPGRNNTPIFGIMAKALHEADPKVHLYCNPCFWEGNGVAPDAAVYEGLKDWYNQDIDVSTPLFLLLQDHPSSFRLFNKARFVRASYSVSTQSAKSERQAEVEQYRRQAWDAFGRGWNGWGFYSYFAPRGNPWNDFDSSFSEDSPDYQMVYPGPRGPIPTRQSESVREGWQDYCLLTLLRQRGLGAELSAILKGYAAGEPMETLRVRALRSVAGTTASHGTRLDD